MVSEALRMKFRKVGSLQFISHLDLCRTMKTAFVRAGIPIWYTEGFNPHPKMVFALTLSVGTQSECEFMDFRIDQPMSCEEIRDRLNGVVTDEMRVLEVYAQEKKFTEVGWAEYLLTFAGDISSAEGLFDESFVITKKSKSGDKELDALPMIRSHAFAGKTLRAVLAASQDAYLNPEYLASAISARTGIADYDILRTKVLCQDGVTGFR